MKFQKELATTAQTFLNPLLSQTCIPYKQWKKAIKGKQPRLYASWSLDDLEKQCQRVNTVFYREYARLVRPATSKHESWLPCCLAAGANTAVAPHPETPEPKAQLLQYAEINATAVYKVCKKLEKTHTTPGAMRFLEQIRTQHRYAFLGSDQTTRLRLDLEVPRGTLENECPICFEDLAPAVVFPCGHYQCFECLCRMTTYREIPATFANRLSIISQRLACPLCRYKLTARTLRLESFWPHPPEDASRGQSKPLMVVKKCK